MKRPNSRQSRSKSTSPQFAPKKKKHLGQHFLTKQSTVDNMIEQVPVTSETTVLEIGCGDGFLTKSILSQTSCKKLLVYEIDRSWANVVRANYKDPRLEVREQNALDLTEEVFKSFQPLIILANLPYQITFPLFFLFHRNRHLIQEGVVMIQEEVAQKLIAQRGKPYSATTIFFQHYFEMSIMEKVEPAAFNPPPKVNSRLLYFKPRKEVVEIPNEEGFWKFLKLCFNSPRQTLRNNLKSTHYKADSFTDEILDKRSQQLSFEEFLSLWKAIETK